MKIGITHRLFLSILAATSLAILCMFLVMQWNISRGFFRYLNTLDQGRVEQMAERLGRAYASHGSWDFLREDRRYWMRRLTAGLRGDGIQVGPFSGGQPGAGRFMEGDGRMMPPPPPPRRRPVEPQLRFIILDAARNPVVGNPAGVAEANFRAIVYDGKKAGYVGLPSPRHFLTPPQIEFLERQKLALFLAALGMGLVVAIISLPMAKRLVKPIKAVADATRDLASGNYLVRVPVSSSDELGQLARDFNAMALTLEKNEKARRQWVADISHELRTPLSVLRGEIEALIEGIRSTTPEAIRSLHTEALRLHRLVDDLYQLALSDLGAMTYRKEELDPVEVLRDSIALHRAEIERKKITLTEEISGEQEVGVFADRQRISQLFSNLLDNTMKYTDTGGRIIVRLTYHKGQIVIETEDSAPGVPAGELDRLFERLYRVEGSRSRSSGGAGLGLAICKNIVEAHDGSISAHNSPLGGLLIRVTISSGRLS